MQNKQANEVSKQIQIHEAFLAQKAEFDAALQRLQALSIEHFDTQFWDVNWGHIGTLQHYNDLLKRITDSAFCEGEFAQE